MSPISIAQYLNPEDFESYFDYIIFDEASQVKTADALGALLRGKNYVIMGDSKQLPPTKFFDVDVVSSDENETEENITPVRVPKKKEILALAESMNHSEGQAIGTVEDMIYEMNSALQDMIFRWNFCREAYAGPVRHRDGKRQIKELAAEGIEYFKAVRKGALWKDEQICN